MVDVDRRHAEPAMRRPAPASPSGEPAWVGLVANAYSGLGRGRRRLHALLDALHRRGLAARVAWTPEERHSLTRAARSESGCIGVVAVGGDGTVSALVNEGLKVPLAVLPTGTENLFARHFGFRGTASAVADTLLARRGRRVDLGRANGRLFALMAGFGFDADIVTRHHRARVSRKGSMRSTHRGAYVEPILRASLNYRFPRLTVEVDNTGHPETLTGTTVFLFNLPRYALGLPFAPDARDDDGLLDLVVFDKPGPFHALRYLWLVFRGLHLRRRGVTHRKVRRVNVSASETVPVQLDGDPAGPMSPGPENGWTVEVVPGGLEVMVPVERSVAIR
jgi:diacylglycerol kinase family enzyme